MRTIQISDDIYAALQRMAVPFEDDINDVLRRLLRTARTFQHDGGHPPERSSAAAGGAVAANAKAPVAAGPKISTEPVEDPRTVKVHRRESNGNHLSQSTIRAGVVGVLRSSTAPLEPSKLLRSLEAQFKDRLTDGDVEVDGSGLARWQNQARNALKQLQYEGSVERLEDGRYRYRGNHT